MQRWTDLEQVPDGLGPTVVTIGTFDGVHRGHQAVLEAAVHAARAFSAWLTISVLAIRRIASPRLAATLAFARAEAASPVAMPRAHGTNGRVRPAITPQPVASSPVFCRPTTKPVAVAAVPNVNAARAARNLPRRLRVSV